MQKSPHVKWSLKLTASTFQDTDKFLKRVEVNLIKTRLKYRIEKLTAGYDEQLQTKPHPNISAMN